MQNSDVEYTTKFRLDLQPKRVVVTDDIDYAGLGENINDFVGVLLIAGPGGTIYENTDFDNPDIEPGVSRDSTTQINLIVDTYTGEVIKGQYTVKYTVRDNVSMNTYEDTEVYGFNFDEPEITIGQAAGPFSAKFRSYDNTNYGSDILQLVREHRLKYPDEILPTPPADIVTTSDTIESPDLYTNEWTTEVTTTVTYEQGDTLQYVWYGTDSQDYCVNGACINSMYDSIDTIFTQYLGYIGTNLAQAEVYKERMVRLNTAWQLCDIAWQDNDVEEADKQAAIMQDILHMSGINPCIDGGSSSLVSACPAWGGGGSPATYAFENGLMETVGVVKLGGSLTGDTTINALTRKLTVSGTSGSDSVQVDIDATDGVILQGAEATVQRHTLEASNDELSLYYEDLATPANSKKYLVTTNGIVENADYSTDYNSFSLVSKGYVDSNFISSNPGTLNGLVAKATPVAADVLIIEDSADSWTQKKITFGDIGGSANFLGLSDTPGSYAASGEYMVRVNSTPDELEFYDYSGDFVLMAAGFINGQTTKATPLDADILLIEDSADSFNKKDITIGSLPFAQTFLDLTDTPGSYATYGDYYIKVNSGATGLEFSTSAGGWVASTGGTFTGQVIFATTTDAPIISRQMGLSGSPGTPDPGNNYLYFQDTDSDVQGQVGINNSGDMDISTSVSGRSILLGNNTSVTGDISVTGTVDGVDIDAFKTAYDSHTHTFASITSKPTTLSGYGITDAMLNTANSWTTEFSVKASAVTGDYLVIEDSADSYTKKYVQIGNLPTSATIFLSLTDTPGSYSGASGYVLRVNSTPNAVEFYDMSGDFISTANGTLNAMTSKGTPVDADVLIIEDSAASYAQRKILWSSLPSGGGSSTFLGLTDTPSVYTSSGGFMLMVNSTPDAVEFVDPSGYGLSNFDDDLVYGNVSNTGTPLNNQVAVWTDATTIEGDANFTWSGTILDVIGTIQASILETDTINEGTAGLGVTIEGNELKDSKIGIGASIDATYSLYVYHASSNFIALFESGDANAGIGFKDNSTTTNPHIRAAGNDLEIISPDGEIEFATNSLARLLVNNGGTVRIYNTLLVDTINNHTGAAGVTIEGIKAIDSYFIIPEVTAPGATPAATEGYLYMDSSDDKIYWKNSVTTYDLTAGGGVTTFIGMTDTPVDWTGGVAGFMLMVDSTPDAVEFIDPSGYAINNFSGTIDAAWTVTGSNTYWIRLESSYPSNGSAYLQFDSGEELGIVSYVNDDYTGNAASIYVYPNGLNIRLEQGANEKKIDFSPTAMTVTDTDDSTGFVYAADYSTAGLLLDRWLPDWDAVKTHIAGENINTGVGGPGDPGAGQDGFALYWDHSNLRYDLISVSGGTNHSLLSATHTDTANVSVTRGDIIIGDPLTQWNVLNISATNTHLLRTDGTDISWGVFDFADLGTTPTTLLGYGILDTKANFDTVCSDGDFAYTGGAFHDGFSDFVGDEHIDHTGVSIATASASGLNNGGTIAATRNLVLSLDRLTAVTTLQATDYFGIYDASVTGTRRISYANILTALNSDLSFGSSDVSVNLQADDRVVTCTGATDVLQGETNLTFSSSGVLSVNSTATDIAIFDSTSATYSRIRVNGSTGADTMISFMEDGSSMASVGWDAGTNTLRIVKGFGVLETLEDMAVFTPDGAFELYHNNTKLLYSTDTDDLRLDSHLGIGLAPNASYSIYANEDIFIEKNDSLMLEMTIYNTNTIGSPDVQYKLKNTGREAVFHMSSSGVVYLRAITDDVYLIGMSTSAGDNLTVGCDPYTYSSSTSLVTSRTDLASGYVYHFFNDGNNANRYGIKISAGADSQATGIHNHLMAYAGDTTTEVGGLRNNAGTFQVYDISDRRRKTDIVDTQIDASGILRTLKVRDYRRVFGGEVSGIQTGWIAQEVAEIHSAMHSYNKDTDLHTIAPTELIPILHKGWQLHEERIETHEEKIARLENKVADLEEQLKAA